MRLENEVVLVTGDGSGVGLAMAHRSAVRSNGAVITADGALRRPDPYRGGVTAPGLKPRVLVIGLDPYRVPGPWDPGPVAAAIELGMAAFADRGVGARSCLFGLDGSGDPEEEVTAALTSEPWECVVIGAGVRTAEDLLPLFERVVNLVRRHAPLAAIAFNSTASDTFEAAARWIESPG